MATKKTDGDGKTAPLDPKIADRLLDLLSTDDDYRELFSSDPQAALAKVGYQRDQEVSATRITPDASTAGKAIYGCCNVGVLASKEAILEARNAIRDMLTGGLAQTTPQLDASLTSDRRTLK
jgi:putative modified peptide